MQLKEHSISIKNKQRVGTGLTTREAKYSKTNHQLLSNPILFTNQAILSSLNQQQKNLQLKRNSVKRPSYQENDCFVQLLKINTLVSSKERNQECVEKQKMFMINKQKQEKEVNNLGKRPKSAVTKPTPFTEAIQVYKKQPKNQTPTIQNEKFFNISSNQDRSINKENLIKDKYKNTNKIKFFTNNPNVFIPRTNKNYCSYLNRSKMNQYSYKTNEELVKVSKGHRNVKRNTVSTVNQKQLQEKCKEILSYNNDINFCSTVSTKNMKRKKIDFSKSHSQFFKFPNTQCSQSALKTQFAQTMNRRSRNSASEHCEHLDPQYRQNMINKFKVVQIHKMIDLKNPKMIKQKSDKSRTKFIQTRKIQTKDTQPSLYIQTVELGVQGSKKQKQYYKVACPENLAHKSIDLFCDFYDSFPQKNGIKEKQEQVCKRNNGINQV